MEINKGVSIVGSGNLAWHLASAFNTANVKINSIFSRKKANAEKLAAFLSTEVTTDLSLISQENDLILICVSDSAIGEVGEQVAKIGIPYAHTAASVPLSVFKKDLNAGVFYPFQTFTKGIRLGESEIPLFIEANSDKVYNILENLAKKISQNVNYLDSEKRKILHISGIIANNFSNFFYINAFKLLNENNIDPKLLLPLIQETVNKIQLSNPENLQTGPARRGNLDIIESHSQVLSKDKKLKELYNFINNSILEYYKKNE